MRCAFAAKINAILKCVALPDNEMKMPIKLNLMATARFVVIDCERANDDAWRNREKMKSLNVCVRARMRLIRMPQADTQLMVAMMMMMMRCNSFNTTNKNIPKFNAQNLFL